MKKDMYEVRKQFVLDSGFTSIEHFAQYLEDDVSNVYKVLHGVQKPRIQKLFKFAEVLECDILQVLTLFYPDEMKKNVRMMNKKHK